MSFGPKEFQTGLYNKLTADSALMALISGVFDHVPQDTAFPYISIGDVQWNDRGSHTTQGYSGIFTIHVWDRSKGRKNTLNIQTELDRILHESTLTISGWNILTMRRQFSDILVENDSVTYHGITRFRILIGAV